MGTHLKAAFFLSRIAYPRWGQAGGGEIINRDRHRPASVWSARANQTT